MSGTNLHTHFMNRCRLEKIGGKYTAPRSGFTLVELVLVLLILALLAGAAMSMVDTQVEQARFDSTTQTLASIERAVLGPDDARGADGTHAVSGFVADCGRLPYYLAELYQPKLIVNGETFYDHAFTQSAPAGDSEVTATGGWNGPYLQKAIGGDFIREGYGRTLALRGVDGSTSIPQYVVDPNTETTSVVNNSGPSPIGSVYSSTNLALNQVFEDQNTGINRWQKPLTVNVKYHPPAPSDPATSNPVINPETTNGETIIVRVYGPVDSPAAIGTVNIGTIGHGTTPKDEDDDPKFTGGPASVIFDEPLPIGPRIIRAYQLDTDSEDFDVDPDKATIELSDHDDLKAVSLPTRIVVSNETSSIDLILRDVPETP